MIRYLGWIVQAKDGKRWINQVLNDQVMLYETRRSARNAAARFCTVSQPTRVIRAFFGTDGL